IGTAGAAPAAGVSLGTAGNPPAPDPAAVVDRLVKAVPGFFVKERAGQMKSNFHLHIAGARPYSIQIENGECKVLEGHQGAATCKITTDAATYIGMAEGKVNPQKAFMEQKLKADVLPEAMK